MASSANEFYVLRPQAFREPPTTWRVEEPPPPVELGPGEDDESVMAPPRPPAPPKPVPPPPDPESEMIL